MVGLGSQTEIVVGSMSVLERKLVMLAGALAMRPSVLLMDEPVSGLTPVEINAFQNILAGALDGSLTVIIIEHVMSFLLKLSQRLLIMHQGRIIFDGPKEEMPSDKQVVEVYLGSNAPSLLSGNVPNGHS
jgi:branched-chain amino acid transport system ATP-binding protein